jgi:hypothetical protein
VVFPHPDLVLNVNRRSGQKHWLRGPVLSYVIEHPDGLLLWDTGISPEWPTEWLEPWQQLIDLSEVTPEVCLLSRLTEAGLGPDDFRYVPRRRPPARRSRSNPRMRRAPAWSSSRCGPSFTDTALGIPVRRG